MARAARARGVRVDAARNIKLLPGLGLTAVASSGERLLVGSRALLLRERVSIALTEPLVAELESSGRSALLVALHERLVGVIGLQDGLRAGARAAVQQLLDVEVEPVMMSNDARETCEVTAKALDIEHIRPELLPAERAQEVKRLGVPGHVVAVVGRSPADDEPLRAADVAVVLDRAGAPHAEWGVQLATDQVSAASYAIRLARDYRSESVRHLLITVGCGVIGLLGTFFGAPPALVPLFAFGASSFELGRCQRRWSASWSRANQRNSVTTASQEKS